MLYVTSPTMKTYREHKRTAKTKSKGLHHSVTYRIFLIAYLEYKTRSNSSRKGKYSTCISHDLNISQVQCIRGLEEYRLLPNKTLISGQLYGVTQNFSEIKRSDFLLAILQSPHHSLVLHILLSTFCTVLLALQGEGAFRGWDLLQPTFGEVWWPERRWAG